MFALLGDNLYIAEDISNVSRLALSKIGSNIGVIYFLPTRDKLYSIIIALIFLAREHLVRCLTPQHRMIIKTSVQTTVQVTMS